MLHMAATTLLHLIHILMNLLHILSVDSTVIAVSADDDVLCIRTSSSTVSAVDNGAGLSQAEGGPAFQERIPWELGYMEWFGSTADPNPWKQAAIGADQEVLAVLEAGNMSVPNETGREAVWTETDVWETVQLVEVGEVVVQGMLNFWMQWWRVIEAVSSYIMSVGVLSCILLCIPFLVNIVVWANILHCNFVEFVVRPSGKNFFPPASSLWSSQWPHRHVFECHRYWRFLPCSHLQMLKKNKDAWKRAKQNDNQ